LKRPADSSVTFSFLIERTQSRVLVSFHESAGSKKLPFSICSLPSVYLVTNTTLDSRSFSPKPSLPKEKTPWTSYGSAITVFDVKGLVETLMRILPALSPSLATSIELTTSLS
jgi:hypothetical protein